MSILIDQNTKIIVQGMTGSQGSIQSKYMLEYGAEIVAGVTPGKEGQTEHEVPIYDSVENALKDHEASWSCIFVPARFVKSAAFEALEAGLNIVIITEGVPVYDTLEIKKKAAELGLEMLGPNCPGMTTIGESKMGIMPNNICIKKGKVGVVSRSGTLTYEIVNELNQAGYGQSTIVGIGGDATPGMDFIDVLKKFENDDETELLVMIGEIGGDAEEKTAEFIKNGGVTKPICAYIVGRTAPKEKQMGHAGAIISDESGSAESKIKALEAAGVPVATLTSEIGGLVKQIEK